MRKIEVSTDQLFQVIFRISEFTDQFADLGQGNGIYMLDIVSDHCGQHPASAEDIGGLFIHQQRQPFHILGKRQKACSQLADSGTLNFCRDTEHAQGFVHLLETFQRLGNLVQQQQDITKNSAASLGFTIDMRNIQIHFGQNRLQPFNDPVRILTGNSLKKPGGYGVNIIGPVIELLQL